MRGARALPALTSPLHTGYSPPRPVRSMSGRRFPAPILVFDFADYQASVAFALAIQQPLSALPVRESSASLQITTSADQSCSARARSGSDTPRAPDGTRAARRAPAFQLARSLARPLDDGPLPRPGVDVPVRVSPRPHRHCAGQPAAAPALRGSAHGRTVTGQPAHSPGPLARRPAGPLTHSPTRPLARRPARPLTHSPTHRRPASSPIHSGVGRSRSPAGRPARRSARPLAHSLARSPRPRGRPVPLHLQVTQVSNL